MKKYEKFIEDNAAYLETISQEATSKNFMVLGFPHSSTKEVFKAVIEQRDIYFLPFCLYLIHFGFGVKQDQRFTASAFKKLLPDNKSYEQMPFLAYIYAYCCHRDGNLELSEEIIKYLADKSFPPALATHGDWAWRQKKGHEAKASYLNAAKQGHYMANMFYIRLFNNRPKLLLRFKLFSQMLFKTISGKTRGEKYVYLDFYDFLK